MFTQREKALTIRTRIVMARINLGASRLRTMAGLSQACGRSPMTRGARGRDAGDMKRVAGRRSYLVAQLLSWAATTEQLSNSPFNRDDTSHGMPDLATLRPRDLVTQHSPFQFEHSRPPLLPLARVEKAQGVQGGG